MILGVDPGLDGAFVVLRGDDSLDYFDMPTLALKRGGKNKRDPDAYGLAIRLGTIKVRHAFIEQVGAMPGQGVSSVFAFGKTYGVIIGALATRGIPMTFVPPQRWKKLLAVPAAKDGARARASQLLPAGARHWPLVKHDGRAEAALIALYGRMSLDNIARAA